MQVDESNITFTLASDVAEIMKSNCFHIEGKITKGHFSVPVSYKNRIHYDLLKQHQFH